MNNIHLVSIGFGSVVHAERILAILNTDSAPIRRKIQESREKGTLVDASYGRKTRSVLIMDNGSVILSAILPETIASRVGSMGEDHLPGKDKPHSEEKQEDA